MRLQSWNSRECRVTLFLPLLPSLLSLEVIDSYLWAKYKVFVLEILETIQMNANPLYLEYLLKAIIVYKC